jgi:hypothetical protein
MKETPAGDIIQIKDFTSKGLESALFRGFFAYKFYVFQPSIFLSLHTFGYETSHCDSFNYPSRTCQENLLDILAVMCSWLSLTE